MNHKNIFFLCTVDLWHGFPTAAVGFGFFTMQGNLNELQGDYRTAPATLVLLNISVSVSVMCLSLTESVT